MVLIGNSITNPANNNIGLVTITNVDLNNGGLIDNTNAGNVTTLIISNTGTLINNPLGPLDNAPDNTPRTLTTAVNALLDGPIDMSFFGNYGIMDLSGPFTYPIMIPNIRFEINLSALMQYPCNFIALGAHEKTTAYPPLCITIKKNCGVTPSWTIPAALLSETKAIKESKIQNELEIQKNSQSQHEIKHSKEFLALMIPLQQRSNNSYNAADDLSVSYLSVGKLGITAPIETTSGLLYLHSESDKLVIDHPIKVKGKLFIDCPGIIVLNAPIEADECHFSCKQVISEKGDVKIFCASNSFSITPPLAFRNIPEHYKTLCNALHQFYPPKKENVENVKAFNWGMNYLLYLSHIAPYISKIGSLFPQCQSLKDNLLILRQNLTNFHINAFDLVAEYLGMSRDIIYQNPAKTTLPFITWQFDCKNKQKNDIPDESLTCNFTTPSSTKL